MTDLIHIDGKPFVLVPMHEYRKLLNNSTAPPDSSLPHDILDRIAAHDAHPVKIIRKFRGLTQLDLAAAAGLSRPYLTEIETGKKAGSVTALKAIATALDVDAGLLL